MAGAGVPMAGGAPSSGMVMGGTGPSTWYYATVEDASGNRREWHVSGSLDGLLAEGDSGWTVTKGSRLIEVDRGA